MAPSNCRGGQVGWMRDEVMLERVGGLSSTREDPGAKYAALQSCPKDTVTAHGSTTSGGWHKRSADPHDATDTTKKVSSSSGSSSNIFTSISSFFAQLGNNHNQDNTHAVTPVTTAGSALSSLEEAPTENYDDEPAPLDTQWGSDSEVVTLPLAGCEKRARSPPIPINVAGKRSSWRTEASSNGGNGGCQGRRAGDPEDQGLGEGKDGRGQGADARAKIKEWQKLCASKKVSFTVREIKEVQVAHTQASLVVGAGSLGLRGWRRVDWNVSCIYTSSTKVITAGCCLVPSRV